MKTVTIITILQLLFIQINAITIEEKGVVIANNNNDDEQQQQEKQQKQPKGAPIGATSQFDPYSNISPLSRSLEISSTTKSSMAIANTIIGIIGSTNNNNNIQWKLLLSCVLFAITSLCIM
ncbi:conserved hypothetical protein [Candida dubliniensis CD36]|uniref:Uncharacterized protein n=1 Tax=Candida dubliniensis (strain CD36 / ATCC MYA-646 / CBS 7987 / NCPF 3949 / NRRL Y-17841) TaxID=573826 RepID=B9WFJ5_CANDC|nr:conserved hypothetical protein [Candida dubliniensis CD36]CAX42014.1 conserved hypothetical protein [Candida dubliniensis CD36]